MTMELQAVKGMLDILPTESSQCPFPSPLWEHFEVTVREWLKAYGYLNIRMPILEPTSLFKRSIGEVTDIVEKEMFSFTDRMNGDELTLRPEGTASCVRAVLQHHLLYPGPQRLFYMGPMFRHENPQKGRYRQFHQVGVEALGFPGPDVDAELLVMTHRLWTLLGLDGIELQINTLGDAASRLRYREHLVDYLRSRHDELDDDSRRRLHSNPLRVLDSKNPAMQALIEAAPKLLDDLDETSLRHFEKLQQWLQAAGVTYRINTRLVRGLDYYNGMVFEWVTDQLGAQGTVCAGGRYDGLIAQLGGKPAPACGFGMGIERLLLLMKASGNALPGINPHIYMVHQGEAADTWAFVVAEQLRKVGLSVVYHCGEGSFKSQMKKADASGAAFAIVIGDDEVAANQVMLKPLRGQGEQTRVSVADVQRILNASN